MPDSQPPPNWGPAYDERDLDALLSGETENLPSALIPLAGALATLHAPPLRSELTGEAAARAVFRQQFAPAAPGPEHGTVPAHTLALPRAADRPPRHTARHRRRPARGGLRRPVTIVGVAAGLALVAGVAVAGLVPGPVRQLVHRHATASPTLAAPDTARASQAPSVDATGSKAPVIRPTPSVFGASATASDPGALCREYYSFWGHPEPKSAWPAEQARWKKLSGLAGSPWKVFSYCLPYVDYGSWGSTPGATAPPQGSPWPEPGKNPDTASNGHQGKSTGKSTVTGPTGPGASSGSNPGTGGTAGPGQQDQSQQDENRSSSRVG